MVLERTRPGVALGVALTALVMLASGACMKSPPAHRLTKPTAIAVAFVHDKGAELGAVPAGFVEAIDQALGERNLVASNIDLSSMAPELARKRASKDRLASVARNAGAAELLLLVEMRAAYYSQINGRYRWTVYIKLSLATLGALDDATIVSFDLPVMLSFDHQRDQEALAYAAAPVARKLGQELDDFLAGLNLETQPVSASSSGEKPGLGPIYFVMLDRFANGDTSNDGQVDAADPQAFHGGDLRGLIDHLDYIKELGFQTLWLAPIFRMRTEKIGEHGAFHGYWTEDLRTLEPRFGSDAELVELKQELEARHMTLVLDMVLNHVGYDTRLVSEKPGWFHGLGNVEDWDDPVQLTTHDVHGLPDLDQDNPEVYSFLLDASLQWIETLSPIGFRLDAVKHVGASFWKRYTHDVAKHAGQGFTTIGELYNGDPAQIASGFAEGGFDHLLDFPLYFAMSDAFCKGKHLGRLASTLSLDRLYSDANALITFADNHDLPRVYSACGENDARVEALLSFMLAMRGLPAFHYGTEAALTGAEEPANRADMVFGDSPRFASVVRRLLELRQAHQVFTNSNDWPVQVDAQHLAYLRRGDKEALLVLVNMSDAAWNFEAPWPLHGASDLLASSSLSGGSVTVAPVSTRILLLPAPSVQAAKGGTRKLVIDASASGASELYLVGGGPELGNWDPKRAPHAQVKGDGHFHFEIELPAASVSAYKLVRPDGADFRWESRENRYLVVDDAAATITTIQFESGTP